MLSLAEKPGKDITAAPGWVTAMLPVQMSSVHPDEAVCPGSAGVGAALPLQCHRSAKHLQTPHADASMFCISYRLPAWYHHVFWAAFGCFLAWK